MHPDLSSQDRAALEANPDLAAYFAVELKREAAFAARDAARPTGVCWSGMNGPLHTPSSASRMMDGARAAMARDEARAKTPYWRLLAAIIVLEKDPDHFAVGFSLHDAWSRMGGKPTRSEIEFCRRALADLNVAAALDARAMLTEMAADLMEAA